MTVRLVKTAFDGYLWGICARGSWLPLMVFHSLEEAKAAV